MSTKLTAQAEAAFQVQTYGGASTIDGVARVALRRFNDEGGSMTELLRLEEASPDGLEAFRARQFNYSVLQPGVIKAFHVHREQTDVWFVPPEDRVLALLVDVREGSTTRGARMRLTLGDGRSELLRIPPGVAHGVRNIGPSAARVLYMTDRVFDPDPKRCDEGRLPWDFVGAEAWEAPRE